MKILVADDDMVTLKRIRRLVESWGYECISAPDGQVAADLYEEERPPIVVTDWLMPGLDGLELLRRIRKHDHSTYVIMLTIRGETEDLVEAMDGGADDFLSKPFANEELLARIRAGARLVENERNLERKNRQLAWANVTIATSHRRIKGELEAAARIQAAFLPRNLPELPNLRFGWRFEPCQELSGDAFNILPFDDSHVGVFVADVSGHGVASSLLSVQLNRLLSRFDEPDSLLQPRDGFSQPPSAVAEKLNNLFPFDQDLVQYFTFLYGVFDLDRHVFRYTSAGHSGPIVVSQEGIHVEPAMPPAVGFFPGAHFTEAEVELHPGDRLFLYTDGIFEVSNGKGEELGENRLATLLAENLTESLDESLSRLIGEVHSWAGSERLVDDLSVVGVEIVG
tara:strand:+ start:2116 stop:3303 length:1188 start_codon:yes stop_codon:yes gene_type:complete